MAIQQLDLFAAFQPPPKVEEKLPEAEPVVEMISAPVEDIPEAIVEEVIQPRITPDPVIINETPGQGITIEEPASPAVIFENENIGVKVKPKIPVPAPVFIKTKEAVTVKPKSKRGRKSYRDIDAELDLIEVPEEEVLNQKMYYSITEVARWFKVNASLLRYWENEFDVLKPRKNRKGDRLFRPEDIKNLQVIYYLLRNRKFSIEGAKKYLRNNRQQADVNVQLAQSLTKFRSFLLELKANLGA
jgi:DNA-binding transcriptional MerR regulator